MEIDQHWRYIGQQGKQWYLKRTRQPIELASLDWSQMNHTQHSKIGTYMNRRKPHGGRYTGGYVAPNTEIGQNRYGGLIQQVLDEINPNNFKNIADLRRNVVQRLRELYPKDDYMGFNEDIASKTVDKLVGVNIKKAMEKGGMIDKAELGTFGTILAGILMGLGGYATIKTIKSVMGKNGYSPNWISAALGGVIGGGLLVGGTKKIISLRKGVTFITLNKSHTDMSTYTIPKYASEEGFSGGHEVITTDGDQGVVVAIQGQYVDIRDKAGKFKHVHVNDLIKSDEAIPTKDGLTRWGLMSSIAKKDLLKSKNIPTTLAHVHWTRLDKSVQQMILKTDKKADDEDDKELVLEDKAHSDGCGCTDCMKDKKKA